MSATNLLVLPRHARLRPSVNDATRDVPVTATPAIDDRGDDASPASTPRDDVPELLHADREHAGARGRAGSSRSGAARRSARRRARDTSRRSGPRGGRAARGRYRCHKPHGPRRASSSTITTNVDELVEQRVRVRRHARWRSSAPRGGGTRPSPRRPRRAGCRSCWCALCRIPPSIGAYQTSDATAITPHAISVALRSARLHTNTAACAIAASANTGQCPDADERADREEHDVAGRSRGRWRAPRRRASRPRRTSRGRSRGAWGVSTRWTGETVASTTTIGRGDRAEALPRPPCRQGDRGRCRARRSRTGTHASKRPSAPVVTQLSKL